MSMMMTCHTLNYFKSLITERTTAVSLLLDFYLNIHNFCSFPIFFFCHL